MGDIIYIARTYQVVPGDGKHNSMPILMLPMNFNAAPTFSVKRHFSGPANSFGSIIPQTATSPPREVSRTDNNSLYRFA